MPIFQDPDRQQFYDLWANGQRTTSQEERRHDQCCWVDHREPDGGFESSKHYQPPPLDLDLARLRPHDRQDLIHYIKRAETSKHSQYGSSGDNGAGRHFVPHIPQRSPGLKTECAEEDVPRENYYHSNSELASPAEIQRPRSALHSGDFREGTPQLEGQQQLPQSPVPDRNISLGFPLLGSSPTTPWFTPSFPPRTQTAPVNDLEAKVTEATRSRAPSFGSFSSSYVLKTPTSPLVHQANNTDLDFSSRTDSTVHPDLMDKTDRRRTLPPETFRDLPAFSARSRTDFSHAMEWDQILSSQSRHPRRSLASSYSLQLASSLQSAFPRPRRPSFAPDLSSRAHAPMVGSYEESILRGRMSMNPSKPLSFTAQIGVLGRGRCKASLKCPPHVTVPFPAVFYSYPTSGIGRSISDDSPSPYVGLIDLENSLPRDNSSCSRRRRRQQSPASARDIQSPSNNLQMGGNDQESLRIREKRHRRAESPKCPPGGCYRIPQQGQLQVMIKNPNKTAVKLFLVPYDLSDMEPGTKTFIRQRSYSAGPIIDMPLSARTNYGTDRPEASLTNSDDPKDKPVLRYLIHLNICCPSKGRYFLHSSIRVVFANRVPDGKENLRNEIQCPEPRYSPYKPSRESKPSLQVNAISDVGEEPPIRDQGGFSHRNSENNPPGERPPQFPKFMPSIRDEVSGLYNAPPPVTPSIEPELYHKLSRGDIGYGGYHAGFTGGSEAGESLLAKRLRGLDV